MKRPDLIPTKICSAVEAARRVAGWRINGKKVAFTNGVFDLLHRGHIFSLSGAAAEADYLVVGVNGDDSVKRLKGPGRPVHGEQERAMVLASLEIVDLVVLFNEDTPIELIKLLLPDVLVKGGDYTVENIAGASEVINAGGRVVINPLLEGFSTSSTIEKLRG